LSLATLITDGVAINTNKNAVKKEHVNAKRLLFKTLTFLWKFDADCSYRLNLLRL